MKKALKLEFERRPHDIYKFVINILNSSISEAETFSRHPYCHILSSYICHHWFMTFDMSDEMTVHKVTLKKTLVDSESSENLKVTK